MIVSKWKALRVIKTDAFQSKCYVPCGVVVIIYTWNWIVTTNAKVSREPIYDRWLRRYFLWPAHNTHEPSAELIFEDWRKRKKGGSVEIDRYETKKWNRDNAQGNDLTPRKVLSRARLFFYALSSLSEVTILVIKMIPLFGCIALCYWVW